MPDSKHQQNLSINSLNSLNSIGSLIEPTTPPSYAKSLVWDPKSCGGSAKYQQANLGAMGPPTAAPVGSVGPLASITGAGGGGAQGFGNAAPAGAPPAAASPSSSSVLGYVPAANHGSSGGHGSHLGSGSLCSNLGTPLMTGPGCSRIMMNTAGLTQIPVGLGNGAASMSHADSNGSVARGGYINENMLFEGHGGPGAGVAGNYSNNNKNLSVPMGKLNGSHAGASYLDAGSVNGFGGIGGHNNGHAKFGGVSADQKLDKEFISGLNRVPLEQISHFILRLAKDQHGCRFLQKKLDENIVTNYQTRVDNFNVIFKEIYPHIYELIIDPFGNYLIQKLVDYCGSDDTSLVLEILQYNLFQISINQHGTRALQKLISSLTNEYQLSLLTSGLSPYITELIKDLNGNHVIQKILNKYPTQSCQFIYDSIINDLLVVATHKHGCCVLQKCLNHVNNTQLNQFSQKILEYETFNKLINDQFGNYVLQYLISINSLRVNSKMYENFITFGIGNLCTLKFSSNVIEKFLKNCYVNETNDVEFSSLKFELILNILRSDLNKLINNPFGNYVIQTLIDILINPAVDYSSSKNNKMFLLLPSGFSTIGISSAQVQVAVIKHWFANCKITSSFGKRIQLKINSILNSNFCGSLNIGTVMDGRSASFTSLNMNANGEFVNSENSMTRISPLSATKYHHQQNAQFAYPAGMHAAIPSAGGNGNNYILSSQFNNTNEMAAMTNPMDYYNHATAPLPSGEYSTPFNLSSLHMPIAGSTEASAKQNHLINSVANMDISGYDPHISNYFHN